MIRGRNARAASNSAAPIRVSGIDASLRAPQPLTVHPGAKSQVVSAGVWYAAASARDSWGAERLAFAKGANIPVSRSTTRVYSISSGAEAPLARIAGEGLLAPPHPG